MRVITMPINNAKQKTAKRRLDIVSATVKKSISVCAIGVKQTGKKPASNHANGVTENWLTLVQKSKQQLELPRLQRQSATKIGAVKKYLQPMAATNALVAAKLKDCFCRLTTFIMTARRCVKQSCILVTELAFTFGCVKMGFLKDSKSYV